jgi:hypothetical protein
VTHLDYEGFFTLEGAVNYENGSSNPTGYFNVTLFNGTSAIPWITSISFEWLVVAGNCAKFGGMSFVEVDPFSEEEEYMFLPYVATLCDNKELNGQDTFSLTGGQLNEGPGEVFWTTSFDPEDPHFDGGSVNITSTAPSSSPSSSPSTSPSLTPSTSPSDGSKKSKNKQANNTDKKKKNNDKKKDGKKMLRG